MDEVLVDLPYVVRETYVLPRRRTPQVVHRLATVPVRLRVAGPDDGVPFRIGRPSSMARHPANGATGIVLDGICHTDAVDRTDGRYGVPMGDPEFFGEWMRAFRAAPVEATDVPHLIGVLEAVHPGRLEKEKVRMLPGGDVVAARVLDTDEDEARARAVASAGRLVLHSGRLASSAVEPVFVRGLNSATDGYLARMPVAAGLLELSGYDDVVAMDAASCIGGEAMVGIPEEFDGWRFPDAECAVVQAWRRLGQGGPDFSWGPARGEAAAMRAFEAEVLPGRVRRERLGEVLALLDGLVLRVGRWQGADAKNVVEGARMAASAAALAAFRTDGPGPSPFR